MNKNKLGMNSVLLLGINSIIGSGIFLLPNQAAKLMGTASIFVLIFDALLVISIALCFAQAATYFDKDGGPYLYAKDAFGEFIGFEVGFVTWSIRMIAEATMAVAFETALITIFPIASPYKSLITSILIISLAIMNILGARVSKVVNNIITVSKLLPLVLFVAIGIFFIHQSNFIPLFPHGTYQSGTFAQASILMFYAFTGFEGLAVAAGDMKNAKQNLPKAIITVILCVASFYILIQIVTTGILGNSLAHTNAPIQEAFAKIAGQFGKALVAAGTLLSTGGLLVASSYITPRSGVALAESGIMPVVLKKRNRYNAPWVSIIISMTITLLIAWSGTFGFLAQISAISRFAQYIPTCLAVIVFAHTKKRLPQSFHLIGGPIIPIIAVLVSVWLLFQINSQQLLIGLGALLIAVPLYVIMKAYLIWGHKNK